MQSFNFRKLFTLFMNSEKNIALGIFSPWHSVWCLEMWWPIEKKKNHLELKLSGNENVANINWYVLLYRHMDMHCAVAACIGWSYRHGYSSGSLHHCFVSSSMPTGAGYSGIHHRPDHYVKRDKCMEMLADFFGDLPLTCCHYMIKNPLAGWRLKLPFYN